MSHYVLHWIDPIFIIYSCRNIFERFQHIKRKIPVKIQVHVQVQVYMFPSNIQNTTINRYTSSAVCNKVVSDIFGKFEFFL